MPFRAMTVRASALSNSTNHCQFSNPIIFPYYFSVFRLFSLFKSIELCRSLANFGIFPFEFGLINTNVSRFINLSSNLSVLFIFGLSKSDLGISNSISDLRIQAFPIMLTISRRVIKEGWLLKNRDNFLPFPPFKVKNLKFSFVNVCDGGIWKNSNSAICTWRLKSFLNSRVTNLVEMDPSLFRPEKPRFRSWEAHFGRIS